jgi:hypothetical protein
MKLMLKKLQDDSNGAYIVVLDLYFSIAMTITVLDSTKLLDTAHDQLPHSSARHLHLLITQSSLLITTELPPPVSGVHSSRSEYLSQI